MIPLKDRVPSRTFPLVTLLLIGANVAIFLIELSFPPERLQALFERLALIPSRYAGLSPSPAADGGMLLRLLPFVTSMFLHGGWLHLIANMWSLWLFGDNVEDRMGRFRFLLFYLLSGFAAGLLHVAFSLDSSAPTVGASGAVAGVMGAYLFMFPTARIVTLVPILIIPLFINIPSVIFIGFWFISQLFSGIASTAGTGSQEGIAWWAHVGGFAFGALAMPLFRRRDRGTPDEDPHGFRRRFPRNYPRRESPRSYPRDPPWRW